MQTPDIGINLHAKADTERIYFKLKLQGLQAKLHVLQPLEVWVFYMNSVHKQAPPEVQMSFRTEKLLSEYCRPGYTSSNGQYIIDSIIIRIHLSTAAFPVWRLVQRGGVSEDLPSVQHETYAVTLGSLVEKLKAWRDMLEDVVRNTSPALLRLETLSRKLQVGAGAPRSAPPHCTKRPSCLQLVHGGPASSVRCDAAPFRLVRNCEIAFGRHEMPSGDQLQVLRSQSL